MVFQIKAVRHTILVFVFFAYLFAGCKEEYSRDNIRIIKGMKLTPLYTGEREGEIYYYTDSSTGLCFAIHSPHGFSCVPCDSLKRLEK